MARPVAVTAAAIASAVGAVALAAAGCAAIPTSGQVRRASTDANQVIQNPQLIPVPPQPDWNARQIVAGFLHASASGFADGHAVARQYLAADLRRAWHPGWAVTVVARRPKITLARPPAHVSGGPPSPVAEVNITGQRLATLTNTGQYRTAAGSQLYHFQMIRDAGIWRISKMPSKTLLLLTKPDFADVYQPHDLYFSAPASPVLVADPVFVPQAAPARPLASVLVRALSARPRGWLSGAARTSFPAGTTLRGIRVSGSTAVVNLGGAAAGADRATRREMAAQLIGTLAVPSYSGPAIAQSVVLKINGASQDLYPQSVQGQAAWVRRWMAAPPPADPPPAGGQAGLLYFLRDGVARVLAGGRSHRLRAAALSPAPFATMAIAPGGGVLAGVTATGRTASTVYSGPVGGRRLVARRIPGGNCTSLSYDRDGDLWAAARSGLWMLPPGAGAPVPVSTGLPAGDTITDLRVAPDGVRVAMIIKDGGGASQTAVGAISRGPGGLVIGPTVTVGTGIGGASQVAWFSGDDVIVLARPGSLSAALYEVPVNGGQPTQISSEPGTVSIASSGTGLAAAAAGRILISPAPNAPWVQVASGGQPAFPG